MKKNKILIIIPCYNEAKSIEILLKNLKKNYKKFDTLVIDDCSSDNTYMKASKMTNTISHIINLGIGGAVQSGIKYAKLKKYDYCVQIDGDLQHDPKHIHQLLKKSLLERSSLTIGSRYFYKRYQKKNTFLRLTGSLLISILLKILFSNIKITDPTSGMRLYDRKAINYFSDNYPQDFPEPISLAMAVKKNMKVTEVPVIMNERKYGQSSIYGIKNLLYMFKTLFAILLIKFF
jgi:glycosyltransferase involved in cell wall biosynthesis